MSTDAFATRRRRALYRATHRGSKELDFLLGRFVAQAIGDVDEPCLAALERLIEVPDPDIASSLYDGNSLGDPALDALMVRLREFHGVVQSAH